MGGKISHYSETIVPDSPNMPSNFAKFWIPEISLNFLNFGPKSCMVPLNVPSTGGCCNSFKMKKNIAVCYGLNNIEVHYQYLFTTLPVIDQYIETPRN